MLQSPTAQAVPINIDPLTRGQLHDQGLTDVSDDTRPEPGAFSKTPACQSERAEKRPRKAAFLLLAARLQNTLPKR